MAEQGPLSGQVLGGKYLLGELLGEGGFGMVYAGQHLLLDRPQAIKLLLERYFSRPKFRERFLREARMVAALDHQHIVHINDFAMEEQAARAYLVMPFLGGGTFHDVLKKQHRPLEMEQVVSYIEQIGSALEYAHHRGVVHLDLKPQNLLVHEDGRLLLADFGLAHLLTQEEVEGGTSLGYGTPHYMAPEHINGQPGKQSDVYSLGVILYQMLVGRRPFEGSKPWEVFVKHVTEPPPPLQALRPELPLELEVVVEKALAKQVTRRYQSAGELVVAFRDALVRAREQARRAEEERVRKVQEEEQARRAEEERVRKAREEEQARRSVEEWMKKEEERARRAREEWVKEREERARRAEEERIHESKEERVRNAWEEEQTSPHIPHPASAGILQVLRQRHLSWGKVGQLLVLALSIIALLYYRLSYTNLVSTTNPASTTNNATNGITTTVAQTRATQTYAAYFGQETATSIAAATATAINAIYPPNHATLAFSDTLQQPSSEWASDGYSCQFSNGSYYADVLPSNIDATCMASSHFGDSFAVEVQMTITQGDCGGITYVPPLPPGNNVQGGSDFLFIVCQDGSYDNGYDALSNPPALSSKAIKTGLHQTNLIAMVKKGQNVILFVNHVAINAIDATNYSAGYPVILAAGGQIGVVAYAPSKATKVAYNNVKVWTF